MTFELKVYACVGLYHAISVLLIIYDGGFDTNMFGYFITMITYPSRILRMAFPICNFSPTSSDQVVIHTVLCHWYCTVLAYRLGFDRTFHTEVINTALSK